MFEEQPYNSVRAPSERLRLLESIVGGVNDAILVTEAGPIDKPGPRIVFANEAFTRMTGYVSQEVIGKTPRIFQGPETDRARLDEIRAALSRQESVRVELLNYRKDGTEYWVEINIVPISDEHDRTTHFVSVQREVTGRKQAEAELRESEELLRAVLVQYASDIITILEADGTIRYESPAVETTFGYSPEELAGKNVFEYVHPNDLEQAAREFTELVNNQEVSSPIELRFRHANGSWRYLEVIGNNLLDDPGVQGIVVNSRDVTGRRQAERTLRESERRLVEAQRLARIGNWNWEVSTNTVVWSEELYRIYGLAPDEFGGTYEDVLEIGHPEDREHVAKTVETAYKNLSKFRFDHRRVHPDRGVRVLTVRGEVVAGESGEPIRMFGTVQDITDRRRTEKALEESEALYRGVVDTAPDAIVVMNSEGVIESFNSGAENIFGHASEEVVGQQPASLLLPERLRNSFKAGMKIYLQTGEAQLVGNTVELIGLRKNGEEFPMELSLGQVSLQNNLLFASVIRDVSERKQAEKELTESERRLTEAQRLTRIGNWETHIPTNSTIWSEEIYRICGLDPRPEEPRPFETLAHLIHPADAEHVRGMIDEIFRGQQPFVYDHRIVRPDGEVRTLHVQGEALANEDGELERIVGTMQDVTELRRAEAELKKNYDLLRAVMEGTTDAVFVKDLQGRYLMINRAGAEALGKSPGEIIGKDDTKLFDAEDGRQVMEADRKVLTAEETLTTEDTKTAEGQTRRTFLSTKGPYRDGEGEVAGMFGVARDITDRKQAEEALRRSEGSLAAAQRLAHVGNWEQVIGGELYWSDELYRIYGFTPQQFVPNYEDVMRVIHPEDRKYIEKMQEEVRRSGKQLRVECHIVRPDGEVRIVQNSFETNYDETGRLTRIAGTVQDITGRKWEERRRAAHHQVTRVLAEVSTLEEATPKILQAICENLEWSVGEFWNIDREVGVLRCIQIWNGPDLDVSEFIEVTHQTTFSRGEGMPGRIWENGEPAWIPDIWEADDFPRMPIALEQGLRGGFGFPILLGENVLGVMSFFCSEVRHPDEEVLDMMTAIGSQIGQFIERKNFESQLQHQALHDDLTDLPNRNLFTDRLQHALGRAKRRKKSVAVLFLDLDNFKYINDTLGHDKGDQLLVAAAERLEECLRPEDTAARLGGDEFAVLLEEIPESGEAELVAERILDALSSPFDLENHRQFTSASVGIVVKNGSDHQPGELLRSADLAMYKAKTTGKNRYALFDLETERRSMQRLELENDLRAALERDEFTVHYQPLVLLETGQIVGMEALVRWEHPRNGLVTPEEFIPVAEETGMIDHIGEKVLREACLQMRGWQERHPSRPPLIIGVNLSAKQLQSTDLVYKVENILRETGLEPESLTLEVTENVLVDDAEGHVHTLKKLRDLGVQFAIDDFGTGYSSLSYLKRLPAGLLKIDGSFVERITEATEDEVLLRGVIDIAHGLNLSVTAEGVETEQQATLLKSLGCDLAQGRYFSDPLPAGEAGEILAKSAPLGDLAP